MGETARLEARDRITEAMSAHASTREREFWVSLARKGDRYRNPLKDWPAYLALKGELSARTAAELAALDAVATESLAEHVASIRAEWPSSVGTVDEQLISRSICARTTVAGELLEQLTALGVATPRERVPEAIGLLAHWDAMNACGWFPFGSKYSLHGLRFKAFVGVHGAYRLVFECRLQRADESEPQHTLTVVAPCDTDGAVVEPREGWLDDHVTELRFPTELGPWRQLLSAEGNEAIPHMLETSNADAPSESPYFRRLAALIVRGAS